MISTAASGRGISCGSPFFVRDPGSVSVFAARSISCQLASAISLLLAPVRSKSLPIGPNGKPTASNARHARRISLSSSTRSRLASAAGASMPLHGETTMRARASHAQLKNFLRTAKQRFAVIGEPRSTMASRMARISFFVTSPICFAPIRGRISILKRRSISAPQPAPTLPLSFTWRLMKAFFGTSDSIRVPHRIHVRYILCSFWARRLKRGLRNDDSKPIVSLDIPPCV